MGRPSTPVGPLWRTLTPDEYTDTFAHLFTRSAFRLEQLDRYINPAEDEPFQRHLRGHADDLAWRRPWLDLVGGAVQAGKTLTRVRVVTEPWSSYTEFELTVAYPPSAAIGEDIRIATRRAPALPAHDFWLTDEPATVARMSYTPAGEWISVDLTEDPQMVAAHRTWRDLAMATSIPLDTYLDSVRRRTA